MKNRILSLCIFFFVFSFNACKEAKTKSVYKAGDASKKSAAVNQDQEGAAKTKLYTIAPNGLSLRKENDVASEKLTSMPLGSEVILLEAAAEMPLEIEHIKGGMHKVKYEDLVGYSFSGFLSPVSLHKKGEPIDDYIGRLKKEFPNTRLESKANDPDFHEGTTDTFTLPTTNWHETFYLVAALYDMPKKIGFPNPMGAEQTVIEDPKKPKDVWDSFMTVTRETNQLQKIEYAYRSEGFGYRIEITQSKAGVFEVEYLAFVD